LEQRIHTLQIGLLIERCILSVDACFDGLTSRTERVNVVTTQQDNHNTGDGSRQCKRQEETTENRHITDGSKHGSFNSLLTMKYAHY
jgi:hypothetical protein